MTNFCRQGHSFQLLPNAGTSTQPQQQWLNLQTQYWDVHGFVIVTTVDGWNPVNSPVEVGSLSQYLQGFSTIPGGCLGFQPSTVVSKLVYNLVRELITYPYRVYNPLILTSMDTLVVHCFISVAVHTKSIPTTADGKIPANQFIGSLFHYLLRFHAFHLVIAKFLNHQQYQMYNHSNPEVPLTKS